MESILFEEGLDVSLLRHMNTVFLFQVGDADVEEFREFTVPGDPPLVVEDLAVFLNVSLRCRCNNDIINI